MSPTGAGRRAALGALVVAALLGPFAGAYSLGAWASGALADRAAGAVARLGAALALLVLQPPPPTPLPPSPEAAAIAALDGAAPATGSSGRGRVAVPALPPPAGVMVGRARVEAAAKAGIRPSGYPVPATSFRPAGLALVGVGAVGVGLRDGDVLTRAGGAPARSDGAVVGAVTAALRAKARAISGEVWRGRQRIIVTVELPRVRFTDHPARRVRRHSAAARGRHVGGPTAFPVATRTPRARSR